MKKYSDVIIGIFLIIFAVGIFVMSNPLPTQSATFPRIVAGIMIFLSALLIVSGTKKAKLYEESTGDESSANREVYKNVVKGAVLIFLYILLMPTLGFFAATSAFIASFMLVYKERSIKKILLTVITLDVFIYFIFVAQLNVPLPQGLIL